MDKKQIAKEKIIACALQIAATRTYLDVSEPGPHDDAQRELNDMMFDAALSDYMTIDIEGTIGGSLL